LREPERAGCILTCLMLKEPQRVSRFFLGKMSS
jgi:hypothetical protein